MVSELSARYKTVVEKSQGEFVQVMEQTDRGNSREERVWKTES